MSRVPHIKQYRARNVQTVDELQTVWKYDVRIKQYWARNVQQYMDKLRAKRAANFEARNVQNCVEFDMHVLRAAH